MGQFAKGDQVVDRRTDEVGVVLRIELAGRSTLYRVQFASGSRYLGEEQLEAATLDPLDRPSARDLQRSPVRATAWSDRGGHLKWDLAVLWQDYQRPKLPGDGDKSHLAPG